MKHEFGPNMSRGSREADEAAFETEVEGTKDQIFKERMTTLVSMDFREALENVTEDDEFANEIVDLLLSGGYSQGEVLATISVPFELRERQFGHLYSQAEQLGSTEAALREYVKYNFGKGYSIGFHTSPFEILPDKDGHWIVLGKENDHRDSDLSRAYYSTEYRHLYKKSNSRFIYVIRTEPESHRTDGNWSRGGKLSIVTKVPISDAVDYVEETFKKKTASSVSETDEAA